MDEKLKEFLSSMIDTMQYAFMEIEDRCNIDLDWEKGQMRKLQEKLVDL